MGRLATTAEAVCAPAADAAELPADVLDQAVRWAVRLESGAATAQDHADLQAWRQAHALHERAWGELQAVEQVFRAVPKAQQRLAHDTLEAAGRSRATRRTGRRGALHLLGWAVLGTGVLALAARHAPWRQQDGYATAVGERRSVRLADGSTLRLNTGSAVEVQFTPLRRTIVLRHGEVHVDTGPDEGSPTGRRPFWVEAGPTRLQALGTRFTVFHPAPHSGEPTRLHVSEGRVAVHAGDATPALALPGQTLLIHAGAGQPARVQRVARAALEADAWLDGVLVARQMRLDDFVRELARYRASPLRCDAAVAELRVSGVFQLDGADPVGRALQALSRSLPVRVAPLPGGGDALVALRPVGR